ncbi:MAG TPA: response regulator transcription factor [Opitutaceae bacterium]|nr:response regulator transcription factor [Opitutaceae bacterium]
MKVLVVEDDRKLGGFLRKGLEAQGFVVDLSEHGDEGYTLATTRSYDALVLDIMLPGRDGLSIVRQLREQHAAVPVILLTARGALHERLDGLNTGADDYLVKPFYIEELAARLHALLRRSSGQPKSLLEHGDLVVNLLTREVKRGPETVELTAREFALLTCLLRSPGRTFTRAQICEHVWNYHFDPGTNLVDVYVQHLRKKLTGSGGRPVIETVRGVGYRVPDARKSA